MAKKGEDYVGFSRSWKSIAGSRLGEHSHPADLRHGLLIVEAEHQGWMQLLQLQQDRMLEEIQRKFPDLEITGMAFRLGKAAAPPQVVVAASLAGKGQGVARPAGPAEMAAPEAKQAAKPATKQATEPDGLAAPGQDKAGEAADAPPKARSSLGEKKRNLPPELVAMFAKIRKNIEK